MPYIEEFMNTIKLYYKYPDNISHISKITHIYDEYLELDATVAYPEGGGQEGDHGIIYLKNNPNLRINFIDTQLIEATKLDNIDYPDCKVGGKIIHRISPEKLTELNKFAVNDEVTIEIDSNRRRLLTQSHSATHIMYMAVDLIKSNIVNNIIGCHIKPEGGRLDFRTEYRFSQDEIKLIEEKSSTIINDNMPITIISDSIYPDVRYWVCGDYKIPCGGTHVKRTNEIPYIIISRKSIGAGKERVIFNWK